MNCLSGKSDGKDKKKKLKPLEAFRKLFSKSTRKRSSKKDDGQVSIVSLKAKSTTALDSGQIAGDDEDEGGFSNTRTLQGTRSISEDSVFNPELKETNPESLKKVAVSEENIPQSSLQAELNAKLKGRLSVYSDDDDADDGLPHSPTPPTTTADIIMGGGLKPLPMSGKSMSRESDLISEDASDEEDTFNRAWRSSVASVHMGPKKQSSPTKEEKSMIDLSSVQSTQVLNSKLSKDKLSVKPLRRSRGQSKKKRGEERSTTPLPGVKEESPTKPDVVFEDPTKDERLPEISSTKAAPSKGIAAPTPSTKPVVTSKHSPQTDKPALTPKTESVTKPAITPKSDSLTKPAVTPKSESVTKPAITPKSESVTKPAVTPKSESVTKPAITPKSESVTKPAITPKSESVTKPVLTSKTSSQGDSVTKPAVTPKQSVPTESVTKPTVTQKSSSQIDSATKPEAIRKNSSQFDHKSSVVSSSSKNEDLPNSADKNELSNVFSKLKKPKSESENVETVTSTDSKDLKGEISETKDKGNSVESSNVKKPSETTPHEEPKKSVINLRPTDSKDSVTSSPKEDYKLKRQNRSKTLPVAAEVLKEDQPVVSVQRANSQRVDPEAAPKVIPTKRQSVVLPLTPTHKQSDGKRLSWVEPPSKTSSSGEPDWLANLRKKKAIDKEDSPAEEKKKLPEKDKSPTEETKTIIVDNKEEKVVMRKKSVGESKAPAVSVKSPAVKPGDIKSIEISEEPTESAKTPTSQVPERKSSIGGNRPLNISTQPAKSEPVKSESPTTPGASHSIASRINSLKSSGGSESSKTEKSSVTTPTSDSKTSSAMTKTSTVVKPTPISKPAVTITKPSPVSKPVTTTHSVTKPDVTTTAVSKPVTTSHIVTKPIATTTSSATKPVTSPVSSKPLSATAPSRFTGPVTSSVKTPSSSFKASESTSSTNKPAVNLSKPVPAKATAPLKESQPKIATSTASDVPAWRRNIPTKKAETGDIKIELIENSAPLSKTEKKVESSNSSSTKPETPTEKSWPDPNNRKSKVLDMVKNFQKFEVS